ncbi:hypothetical protein M9H77_21023 [Catharanthus roseus]|uniref:Uncharacterized protein n=1 Tax=Catharanthus roseus TaxID=4058 RepID=A0ACC0AN67_CATRO|nr:hypothetical protein M9H77_21023 [Catharanthus roseus]
MKLRGAYTTRSMPREEKEEEEAKSSDEEYDESDSSIRATLEQMQIRQTQHSNALAILETHSDTKMGVEVERANQPSRNITLKLVFSHLETKSLVFVNHGDNGHRPSLIYLSLSFLT